MYVFDLEGTLTNSTWREKWLPDYEKFHKYLPLDVPKQNNLRLLQACYSVDNVVILTGAMEKERHKAELWLKHHKVPHSALFMRPNDDFSSSPEFKVNFIRNDLVYRYGKVRMLFDDRADIVMACILNNIPAIQVT